MAEDPTEGALDTGNAPPPERATSGRRVLQVPVGVGLALVLASGASAGELPWPPRIDPLGNRTAYAEVRHDLQTSTSVKSAEGERRRVRGERWVLRVDHEVAESEAAQAAYRKALIGAGAELVHEEGSDLYHRLTVPEASEVWWSAASFRRNSYKVEVVRTLVLRPDEPVEVTLGGEGLDEVALYAEVPGTHLTTLEVSAPPGSLTVRWDMDETRGVYRRRISDRRSLSQVERRTYRLADVPQDAGRYQFQVGGRGSDAPPEPVRLVLRQGDPIPAVQQGEAMGGLRVEGAAYGVVSALPEGDARLTHPELSANSLRADTTPRGDSLLILPPGLWKVTVSPPPDSGVRGLETRLVPVHAGKLTVLRWPPSTIRAFGRPGKGTIEITDAEATGTEATLHFHLLGDEAAQVTPTTSNTEVREGERPGEVLEVRRVETPPEVVLLLDSSGSMKGQMRRALDETRRFLRALPGGTRVRVVDFDTRPRLLAGETPEAVLESLTAVRARGATALYDSILEGLEMLRGRTRPVLVVFTDGVDANWNDTAPGSEATKPEVLEAVREAEVPVFTIGFGAGHDRDTLERVAALSGGLYFPSDAGEELGAAFESLVEGLGRAYALRYRRPARPAPSAVPVVHFTLDTSGSMGEAIGPRGSATRMAVLQGLLGDLIRAKAASTLASIQSFANTSVVRQVPTPRRSELLRALGTLDAEGGTEVVDALDASVASLAAVPSTRRFLVFVTDAALSIADQERERYETLLGRLVDEGVRCLWVGLGLDPGDADLRAAFEDAARRTGGRAVVSADPQELAAAFEALTRELATPATPGAARSTVRLTLQDREPRGGVRALSSAELVAFPVTSHEEGVEAPEAPETAVEALPPRYDEATARYVTGDDPPRREAVVARRLPLDLEASNRAARLVAEEALVLSRLRGLDAPDERRFLGLTLSWENRLPEQDVVVHEDGSHHPASWAAGGGGGGRVVRRVPTYVVGDLQRHLFLRFNGDTLLPVSTATWLTAAPLVLPGELGLSVPPGAPVTGTAVFLVPDAPLQQASLHFYDSSYGHVDLPLVGEMPPLPDLASLPDRAPVDLGETFALRLRGVEDTPRIGEAEAGEATTFRVVDLDLISRVAALLQIDPFERLSLRLPTHRGELHVPLHGATALAPLGLARPTFFPPGSTNRVRLAFRIPEVLAKSPHCGDLTVELRGEDVRVALADPGTAALGFSPPPPGERIRGDGIDLVINGAGARERLDGDRERWRIVDMTLFDHPDGASTRLFRAFELVRDDAGEETIRSRTSDEVAGSKGLGGFARGNAARERLRVRLHPATGDRLFGLPSGVVVPDGGHRRGVLVFQLPNQDDGDHGWTLRSSLFPSLAAPVPEEAYGSDTMLLARRPLESSLKDRDREEYQQALQAAVQEHRALGRGRGRAPRVERVGLGDDPLPKQEVPAPSLVLPGAEDLEEVRDLAALRAAAASLRWVPGRGERARDAWAVAHAPEAVLTQGWGSAADLARMAEVALIRQGLDPARCAVRVTDAGRAALAARGGIEGPREVDMDWLPGLRYQAPDGAPRLLVAPFLRDAADLSSEVDARSPEESGDPNPVRVRVEAWTIPAAAGRAAKTRDMAAALAGGAGAAEPETQLLMQHDLSLEALSRQPIHIGYTEGEDEDGKFLTAVLDGPGGRVVGERRVPTERRRVTGLRVSLRFDRDWHTHEHVLGEGEEATGVFHTLGLGLPDLPPEAAARVEAARQRARRDVEHPDELSALRWFTTGVLGRFLAGQTRLEAEMAQGLGVTVGRTSRPRAILVTVSRSDPEGPARTVLDLRRVGNQVHSGTIEARRAFRLMAGLAAGRLEEEALPGGGRGLFHVWSQLPEETRMLVIGPRDRGDASEAMADLGYPETMVERVERGEEVLLFPTRPAEVDGRLRWAWLEVHPETFEATTVLADGSHGAMVEVSIQNWASEAGMYLVGAMVGIDAALWSVSAFSLVLADYEEIVERAEAFARGLGELLEGPSASTTLPGGLKLEGKAGIGGTPSAGGSTGPVKFELKPGKLELGENLLGFGNGYKAAVEAYFDR